MTIKTSQKDIERVIGALLRAGVISAAAVVLAGGIWLIISSGSHSVSFSAFQGEPSRLRKVGTILSGLFSGDSRVLIQTGLLVLIATPIARVVFSLIAFAVQRDRLYIVITLVVLLALLFSLSGG